MILKTNSQFLIGILCLFCCFSSNAKLQTFEIYHRNPQEIQEIIQPLLDEQGTVVVAQRLLIVNAPEPLLQQISELIRQLDVASRQFLISVKIDEQRQRNHQRYSTQRHRPSVTTMRVLEGNVARIEHNKLVPVLTESSGMKHTDDSIDQSEVDQSEVDQSEVDQTSKQSHFGAQSFDWKTLPQGTYIRPIRVLNHAVMLEVVVQTANVGQQQQQLEYSVQQSTVEVPLGQWVELFASEQTSERRFKWSTDARQSSQNRVIYVKIEQLK